MLCLVLVSLVWAFSFGLTKGNLVGLDSAFISAARLSLALLVFLPFLRLRGLSVATGFKLTAIGAVQFGLMYLALNESYRYLQAYEVVLFTITTPILVTLFADALDRTFRWRALAAAVLAVLGAAFIAYRSAELKLTLTGVVLVQLSNAAFALGQVAYRRLRQRETALRDRDVFGLLYLGASVLTLAVMFTRVDITTLSLTTKQLWTLLYLGVLASGLCFFLWNVGATQVGSGTLAVMNNAKAPLGVACSLLFFGETAPLLPLIASLCVFGLAVWLARSRPTT
ncbi:MAG: EamA family transporter [Verrucomicrobiota bacterium]